MLTLLFFKQQRGRNLGKLLGLSFLAVILVIVLTLPAFAQTDYAEEGEAIVPTPKKVYHYPDLNIEVWVNKGEGAVYHPDDDIRIYFRTNRDAYVMIYNIDTRGFVNLLYPYGRDDDFYVQGGRTYRVPDKWDDYDLTVDGPAGLEYVVAVASPYRFDLPNWPTYYGTRESDYYRYRLEDEDPYDFIEMINDDIIPRRYEYTSDVTVFSVKYSHPRWYYHPDIYYYERPTNIYFGAAYIFSDYWGAEVWIDGIFYGYTPITIPALIIGPHFVTIYYNGCLVWRNHFDVYVERTVRVKANVRYRPEVRIVNTINKEYRVKKEKGIDIREDIYKRRGIITDVKEREIERQRTELYKKEFELKRERDQIQREKLPRVEIRDKERYEKERKEYERPKVEEKERYKQEMREKESRPFEGEKRPQIEPRKIEKEKPKEVEKRKIEKEKPEAKERKVEKREPEKTKESPEQNKEIPRRGRR